TVIEYADRIIPTEDADISKEMQKLLAKKGITFATSAKVLPETLETAEGSVTISAEFKGETKTFTAEKCWYRLAVKRMWKASVSKY
ncbi:NAD-binding protein, partial [Leptospira santarosai]|nr:NAD-binding protein [Leptospira santarosai]